VVVNECVDAMSTCIVDKFFHVVEICLVVNVFLVLNTRPHHTQSDSVVPVGRAVYHVLLGKRPFGVVAVNAGHIWRYFYDDVCSVDSELASLFIVEGSVLD
jgi:hypothetical protein